jgi:tRNA threonylcarbamoyladenosine biosynthesis protein TsaB
MRGRDAEALMPAVAAVMRRAGVSPHELSRVICGAGPGSFTSLRIAASIAKGLAFAVGSPLFAISSLALLAAGAGAASEGRYLAVLDALRGESYVGGYSFDSRSTPSVILPDRIVRQEDVASVAASIGATTIGPGQSIDLGPHARALPAIESFIVASRPVDLASREPGYGRMAEAQRRWEAAHGQPLPGSGTQA